jgi:microcystin-dependent protein
MAWPTASIPTTNLDSGSDSPAAARADLLAAVQALNAIIAEALPAGALMAYAGATAPGGWLLCAGQAVSRTTYAALFTAIGATYGAGDGSTTFNLPDLRGRVAAGKDDMGGTAAGLLTAGGSGITGTTLGAVGGAETHTLTAAQIPAHTHPITALSGRNTTSGGSETIADTSNNTTMNTNANTGGGGAHNNTQPTLVANFIIKT